MPDNAKLLRQTAQEHKMDLQINGKTLPVNDAATMDGTMPLLWVLRDF
jgi:hypothetical protein